MLAPATALFHGEQRDSGPGGFCPHAAPVGTRRRAIFVLHGHKYHSPRWQRAAASTALVPVSFTRPCYQMEEISRALRAEGLAAPPDHALPPSWQLCVCSDSPLKAGAVGSSSLCPQRSPRLFCRLKAVGREFLRTGTASRALV